MRKCDHQRGFYWSHSFHFNVLDAVLLLEIQPNEPWLDFGSTIKTIKQLRSERDVYTVVL